MEVRSNGLTLNVQQPAELVHGLCPCLLQLLQGPAGTTCTGQSAWSTSMDMYCKPRSAAHLRYVDAVWRVAAARLLLVAVLEAPPALLVPRHHAASAAAHLHATLTGPNLYIVASSSSYVSCAGSSRRFRQIARVAAAPADTSNHAFGTLAVTALLQAMQQPMHDLLVPRHHAASAAAHLHAPLTGPHL
jgi:hypothetical protein